MADSPKAPVGGCIFAADPITFNESRPSITLKVRNTGDRPIQVGSHFHFFEVNRALEFDRAAAYGMRLNIPSTTAIRFEPGDEKTVSRALRRTVFRVRIQQPRGFLDRRRSRPLGQDREGACSRIQERKALGAGAAAGGAFRSERAARDLCAGRGAELSSRRPCEASVRRPDTLTMNRKTVPNQGLRHAPDFKTGILQPVRSHRRRPHQARRYGTLCGN